MNSNKLLYCIVFLLAFSGSALSQKAKQEPLKHEQQVKDIVAFFEYMLNTIGDASTPVRDKEVLITESYSKIFRDPKVQIEDDLDPERFIATNKDVQAYLKDVDFFFKNVKFEFTIDKIESEGTESDKLFYKVTVTRNLAGVTADGKQMNNTVRRFIEINYNAAEQDLKIVSVYTNLYNEKKALADWWSQLSFEWKEIFQRKLNLQDSVSLDDIRKITSIDTLDVSNNFYIRSIGPLSQLLDLRVLNVSGTGISDITPIRNLTNLVSLDLTNTNVRNLEALRYSVKLRELGLSGTLVDSLTVLKKLSDLTAMDVSHTPVNDFSALSSLTNLEKLNLEGCALSSLDPVRNLVNLANLNVAKTKINDLSPLVNLPKIQTLNLDSTSFSNVEVLSHLRNLRILSINATNVGTLEPLKELPYLERIYCDHTAVNQQSAGAFLSLHPDALVIYDSEDLRGWWQDLPSVWRDVFSRTARVSYKPSKEELARVTKIDSVNIANYTSVRNLDPLKKLPQLKVLIAGNTSVSDLSILRDHKKLQSLDISGTDVRELSPVLNFVKLRILRADYTPVTSIDTLSILPDLRALYVDGTTVDDKAVQHFLKQKPECLIVYKTTELEEWWGSLTDEWKQVFRMQFPVSATPCKEKLHRLIELQNLQFADVRVEDLSAIAPFIRLSDVRFSRTAIRDISPLAGMRQLRILHINDNPIADLTPVCRLKSLEDLDISNTAVDDLRMLVELGMLQKLNCSGTQVRKLTPLRSLNGLIVLDCSNTKVRSLTPVTGLPLTQLKCYNTRISPGQVKNFRKKNPECNVTYYR